MVRRRNTDEEDRRIERAAAGSGDTERVARLLVSRVRSGRLDPWLLRAAVLLEHEAALATGYPPLSESEFDFGDEDHAWADVHSWGVFDANRGLEIAALDEPPEDAVHLFTGDDRDIDAHSFVREHARLGNKTAIKAILLVRQQPTSLSGPTLRLDLEDLRSPFPNFERPVVMLGSELFENLTARDYDTQDYWERWIPRSWFRAAHAAAGSAEKSIADVFLGLKPTRRPGFDDLLSAIDVNREVDEIRAHAADESATAGDVGRYLNVARQLGRAAFSDAMDSVNRLLSRTSPEHWDFHPLNELFVWGSEYYADRWQEEEIQENPPRERFVVRSVKQGLDLINHPAIRKNFAKALRWRPRNKLAVLVPCAGTKPFPEAPSHKQGYLAALDGKKADLWVVSEPLGVVPYDWSTTWPNDAYDYPPKFLRGDAWDALVERVAEWLERVAPKYRKVFVALPGHHERLLRAALELHNPGNLRDATHSQCLESGACPSGHGRATSTKYREYLGAVVRNPRFDAQPGYEIAFHGIGDDAVYLEWIRVPRRGGGDTDTVILNPRRRWRLDEIKKSWIHGKKYAAIFHDEASGRSKTTHFGATGYEDYTTHRDDRRKRRYIERHGRGREDWNDPTTPGALSRWILWNKPTLEASVKDFRRRFGL